MTVIYLTTNSKGILIFITNILEIILAYENNLTTLLNMSGIQTSHSHSLINLYWQYISNVNLTIKIKHTTQNSNVKIKFY